MTLKIPKSNAFYGLLSIANLPVEPVLPSLNLFEAQVLFLEQWSVKNGFHSHCVTLGGKATALLEAHQIFQLSVILYVPLIFLV